MTTTRILLIDDNPDLLETLEELFALAGYEVLATSSIELAIDLLRSRDFAAVLTNLKSGKKQEIHERISTLVREAAPARVGILSGWNVPPDWLPRDVAFALLKPVSPETLLASVAELAAPRRPAPEEEALIRAYFAALSAKDWDALVALCAPDVVYQMPGDRPPWSKRVEGRDAFREFSRKTFEQFPDATFDVQAMIALASPYVVARFTSDFTIQGQRTTSQGAVFFALEGGLIRSIGIRMATDALATPDAR